MTTTSRSRRLKRRFITRGSRRRMLKGEARKINRLAGEMILMGKQWMVPKKMEDILSGKTQKQDKNRMIHRWIRWKVINGRNQRIRW